MGLLSWGSLSVGLHAMSHGCLGGPTRLWGCSHTCSFLESTKHVLCCSSPRLFLRNLYINLALRAPWGTQVIKGNPKAPKRKLIYSIFYIFIKEREICLWSVNRRQILREEPRIQVCLLISHPARHSCSRWAAPLRTQQGPQVQCSQHRLPRGEAALCSVPSWMSYQHPELRWDLPMASHTSFWLRHQMPQQGPSHLHPKNRHFPPHRGALSLYKAILSNHHFFLH